MTTSWKSQAPASLSLPTAAAASNIPSVVPLHMTPPPESLQSPVDPEFLEGASSSARFGLDIGGTLCKVVFFEPIITASSVSSETPRSRLSRMSFEGSECSNGVCSDDDHHPPQVSSNGVGVMADVSRRKKSSRQARKMWVSSHEPVHLPGRGTLYFKCFETWKMEEFLTLTKEHSLVTKGRALGATGGGARKFKDQFLEIADLQLQRADELTCLVRGIDFLARHAHHDSFEYPSGSYQGGVIQRPLNENRHDEGDISHTTSPNTSESSGDGSDSKGRQPEANTFRGPVLAPFGSGWLGESEDLYPYLVVNIGSGVSMLRVDDADKFQRVGGTSLGGSTFLGLASALTGCTSFEEAINYAMEGDSTQIDMLVGDIYGGDYTEMGLAATTVASSFGKLVQPGRCEAAMQSPQHMAKAVLLMVTNNIGSIAMLHAQAAGVRHVMFTGSFLHENKLAMRLLAVAMEFWSKGNIKAVFLRHEGHAGAMGALLNTLDPVNQIDSLLLNGS